MVPIYCTFVPIPEITSFRQLFRQNLCIHHGDGNPDSQNALQQSHRKKKNQSTLSLVTSCSVTEVATDHFCHIVTFIRLKWIIEKEKKIGEIWHTLPERSVSFHRKIEEKFWSNLLDLGTELQSSIHCSADCKFSYWHSFWLFCMEYYTLWSPQKIFVELLV